jgi:hypothetical protein
MLQNSAKICRLPFFTSFRKENFTVMLRNSQLRESANPYQYIIKLLVKSGQYKRRKSNKMLDNQTFLSTRHFLHESY